MAESLKHFQRRVVRATGLELADIPVGNKEDVLGGTIMCRRGNTCVVTHGYPDYEEDGVSYWDPRPENFRVVNL